MIVLAKNWLLMRSATETERQVTPAMIPKPKGTVGVKGFSLMMEMGLNKDDPEDNTRYKDILVSPTQGLIICAHLYFCPTE